MSHLFQWGEVTLHSGETSSFKIDCDALTLKDWICLTNLAASRLPPYSSVYGIPTGGQILAEGLRGRATGNWSDPTLIVDDVYTTGGSMREARAAVLEPENSIGLVIFARQPVLEDWITALFTLAAPG